MADTPKLHHVVPANYTPKLGLMDTQKAILLLKTQFQKELGEALNLTRVSAPLFVRKDTGLNDDLNGIERPVSFETLEDPDITIEIVQSLAKWKRQSLYRYGVAPNHGIYTDMNAIRRDEITDNLHSIYVDQWDWEKVIERTDRTLDYLKQTVRSIHACILKAEDAVAKAYPVLDKRLPREITFITTQELEHKYPELTPSQRELAYTKEHKGVFIMQIGWPLERSGERHDGRAPDYDDWSLNGDLLYYNEDLQCSMEISSMGIRVDADALEKQLSHANCEGRKALPFHKALLDNTLPLSMGGGIGQSRLCMLLLHKAHVGEIQCSIWPDDVIEEMAKAGVTLL
ncbi:aspartate--ammonia ligase [Clostridia bacterium OttesenSCG-928-F22]|nr:aspartate--ammonia ligase [Clostridia bacterium OttesenSCG-928-F22]